MPVQAVHVLSSTVEPAKLIFEPAEQSLQFPQAVRLSLLVKVPVPHVAQVRLAVFEPATLTRLPAEHVLQGVHEVWLLLVV